LLWCDRSKWRRQEYFLKNIKREIEANKGTVEITPGERLAVLKQNQFEFDEQTVLNT
jgi:ATPase components of ABC transporters with duplicated ATPase domains